MAAQAVLARAKVNLFLHVGPVEADGYHPVSSLAAFAETGDRLTAAPGRSLSLRVVGPFAAGLEGPDNLVLRAVRALAEAEGLGEPDLAFTLDKRLPVASGLGGGSCDAGAALRLTRDRLAPHVPDARLADIARTVGADGPLCLHARAAWAAGRGDRLAFEPRLPSLPALLVNPRVPSPTGAVYAAYDRTPAGDAAAPAPPVDWSPEAVVRWLGETRNDLEAPAIALEPAIGRVLEQLRSTEGARLVRMSGSGATVFALFDTLDAAEHARVKVARTRPGWWSAATRLS